ncbi:short chain dehydrogenase [Mycena olivaceomarginata]|nr:short chain dehydrogenase [Mycena olivaceomarginata]
MAHPNFILNSRTLIIGGSSGLGGSKVHITSVTTEKLSTKITQLQSLYPNAHVSGSPADLSNTETLEANIQSVLDAAVKETGGVLDHIVYTAGDSRGRETLAEATAAQPRKYLNPAASSSITLTSGVLAHRPRPGSSSMIGVAGAVEVLTRALAVDLAPIRVNVVIPGLVDTELVQGMFGGNTALLSAFEAASLTKKIGTPEGAAEAYLFSMRSALATGQGFKIDNGSLLA